MRLLVYILLTANCLLITVHSFSQTKKDDWVLYKSEKGISVYSRKTVNSDYKELKVVFSLKTSLNSVWALLNDWASYPEWNFRCGESKILKEISPTELINYQTTVAPWPVEDRDFIVNIKLSQDEKTKIVTIQSKSHADYVPLTAHHVRIKEFSSLWTLIPFPDGTVQLSYQFLVNPAGYIPAWIVNMAVLSGPYETMSNFKTWLLKAKYQKAKSTLIKELN